MGQLMPGSSLQNTTVWQLVKQPLSQNNSVRHELLRAKEDGLSEKLFRPNENVTISLKPKGSNTLTRIIKIKSGEDMQELIRVLQTDARSVQIGVTCLEFVNDYKLGAISGADWIFRTLVQQGNFEACESIMPSKNDLL